MGKEGEIGLVLGQGPGDLGAETEFSPREGRYQASARFDNFEASNLNLRNGFALRIAKPRLTPE